jgi:4-diphosphocytidyl-2-C-methyl-D-erythritol kinase
MSSGRERVVRAVAPAKLNLGLAVVGKRADGYHDLLTIFQAIDLADELEFRPGARGIELQVDGEDGIPEGSENLVVRAAESLAKARGIPPLARVRLRKRIPAGSGLGGGSSDAAAALVALESLWGIESDPLLLRRLALELGSDVPFFLTGGTARGEGRGEILTPLPPPPPLGWLLAIPEFRCSTREVFEHLPPGLTGSVQELRMLELAISHGDAEMFATHLVNDLELGVARIEPRVLHLKEALRRRGATAVGLTGSGSAMFALFRSQGDVARVLDAGSPLEGVRLIPCAPVDFGARVTQGNDDHRYPDHSSG